jgi:MFS transporter, NNP family, nitrate/nitrite transporter
MVGCMVLGAIPSALAGTATNAGGLIAIRFFVGILGGTFVPCQVWCTGFFDKNCVSRANALAAGWGNAGGGITYFVMPAYVSWTSCVNLKVSSILSSAEA